MIDLCIPEGALEPDAEARLLDELSATLIRLEGFDPADERARAVTWIFLHRPSVFVAGRAADKPRYRVVAFLPEGQSDDAVRDAVVLEVTQAIARAEGTPVTDVGARVWVFPTEVPDGTWGGWGAVRRLPDIVASLEGEQGRAGAAERLEKRRRQEALRSLGAAFAALPCARCQS